MADSTGIFSTSDGTQHDSADSCMVSVDEADIRRQLQGLASEISGCSPASESASEDSVSGILESLERQTASLHALTDGLQQFQQHVVSDILEAIEQHGLKNGAESTEVTATPVDATDSAADSSTGAAETTVRDSSSAPVNDSWERIRQAMLESAEDSGVEPAESDSEAVSPAAAVEPAETVDAVEVLPEPLDFEIPDPFDCSAIEDEDLRAVFLEREEILRLMSLRLLQRTQPAPGVSTQQLREIAETLPEDLRERVERSLGMLDEQLRLTELELSLERARMARQKTSLEETRCTVENNARQLGYTINSDGTLETPEDSDAGRQSGSRWMRVLGFGR